VSKPVKISPQKSPAGSQVWVVKKSKKPYLGAGDRTRKMREVDVLYALRGNDHVLDIKTHWEADAHLYIQTEYCEGGNLRKYLDTVGFNSRLDDFRIWKILLELSMVSINIDFVSTFITNLVTGPDVHPQLGIHPSRPQAGQHPHRL
jgi:mitosis inhibitor protein kinase SWE1